MIFLERDLSTLAKLFLVLCAHHKNVWKQDTGVCQPPGGECVAQHLVPAAFMIVQ